MAQLTASPHATIPAGVWRVDPSHTTVEFGIKHLLITTVKGSFGELEGAFAVEDDGSARATGIIRAASIDTHEPKRDEHLRSPDFFDAAGFPEIRFKSKEIAGFDGSAFRLRGDLTIKDVTREIELDGEYEGTARDPYGNERIGLILRGQLDPNDYGVDWNMELESGGNLIGDRVDFTVHVSAIKEG